MKKKIVFIAPHLSTGGMPQYLVKQIELIKNDCEVYCVEWGNVTGGVLVVQRNKVVNLLGDRLITLGEDKYELFNVINKIQPDVIHLQEIPELFMENGVAEKLYASDRNYVLIETSHDSGYDPNNNKLYLPDKFLMVSQYQANLYKDIDIPCDVVEYPIENKIRTKTREQALRDLGLDPNLKHVINVGLFTPRKNQAEVIEYARMLQNYPIQFHFIGNQADNFKFYWEPLMQNFPKNCKWWNERSDVDSFYEAADLFLFTSRGNSTDHETMPLVIREALSWKTPSLIYNLPVYMGYFDKYETIEYLTENVQQNTYRIAEKLLRDTRQTVKLFEDVNSYFDFEFIKSENKIIIKYKKQEQFHTKVSVKDKDSNAPIYWFDTTFENYSTFWVMPVPKHIFDFETDPSFGSFLIEFYTPSGDLKMSKELYVKDLVKKQKLKLNIVNPFDCLFNNYNEMFVDNKYDCYGLNNLDVVLDIGANNGLFSLLMLNNGCKKVYALEPNETSLINLNSLFKDTDAVTIVEKAIYTQDKDLEFYIDPNNTTIGSINETHLIQQGSTVQKIIVPAISLKTFIQEHNISRISLVKMDIEGAEYDIIEQLEDEVYEKIDGFLIEYHDNTDRRIVKMVDKLKQQGYDIEQIRNQNSKNNDSIANSYETSPIGTFLAKKRQTEAKLTVVIPTYNHEKYVEECVDSLLKQKTLFNFDILISDDCSTDKTYDILQKYKDIPNITLQRTPQNEGPTPLRLANLLKQVRSDYATFLDGDDYYLDEYKLQKQMSFLEENPEYVIHSTGWFVTEEDSPAYEEHGFDGTGGMEMFSLKSDMSLKDNCVDFNYVGFGFMFKNKYIVDTSLPSWVFDQDIFDGYWALINVLLAYGNAKNEDWVAGRYRITPHGHFGEKDTEWKKERVRKQLAVLKRANSKPHNPILIVDAFFHNNHCVDTFKTYLTFVKKLDIPIMLVTNSKFDASLVEEVDYVIYDSNNRLFQTKYKDVDNVVFYWMNDSYYISIGEESRQLHGLSVLSNLYHSTNLAKSLGYTHFYRIEYDAHLGNLDNVKQIIDIVEQNNTKGLIHLNDNKYVSFQIWYFELDYFTKYFPKINNENDYVSSLKKFDCKKDFIIAEEFVHEVIKSSEGGLSNVVVKPANSIHTDYGDSVWNTITSPVESKKLINGCVSTLCRVTITTDGITSMKGTPRPDWKFDPEACDTDTSKVAFITWNCSSDAQNHSVAKITYPDGTITLYEHNISGPNQNQATVIDVMDGDMNIEITLNGDVKTNFTINRNTLHELSSVYQSLNHT